MPTLSRTKFDNLQACANDAGIIAAAAMDQRGSLQKALKSGGGSDDNASMAAFKLEVTESLTPHATALLLDPTYGLEASRKRAANTGLLLAYETSGYDNDVPGRLPDLLPTWSVTRLVETGANGVKLLLYYNPFDRDDINEQKHAFIERVGAECDAVGLPFFLEPVTYNDDLKDKFEFAKVKPQYVKETMRIFSEERYGVDILKVEIPFDANYTEGYSSSGLVAYSQDEAQAHTREAANEAKKPFIYLSAGVDMDVFIASLKLAGEAGVPFSGVLCGRATWKGAIPIFAQHSSEAMREWLEADGVANIKRLNEVVDEHAKPWWHIYGGKDKLEITEPA